LSERRPKVSIGVPVRNAQRFVARALDSALAQGFGDFEIVVCDNASDDGTPKVLEKYAHDRRVRLHRNEENIGLIENVNRVFRLARGEYFRWLGADDWLEPDYLSRCVAALEARPDAVGVSTAFRVHLDTGESFQEIYAGEMPDSSDPVARVERMLWFFHASDRYYDPVYSLYRRNALARSGLIRMCNGADMILSLEMCLFGPFLHLRESLSHRRRAYQEMEDWTVLMQRYHPTRWREVDVGPLGIAARMAGVVARSRLTLAQRARCLAPVLRFAALQARRDWWRAFTVARRRLGITRRNLPFLPPGRS
jgi:glycosyltransferase involved in cell wall biosynthesis